MAYQYPYDEELRRVSLNPEMVRHRVRKDAQHTLAIGLLMGIPAVLFCGGALVLFAPLLSWGGGVVSLILNLFFVLLFGACTVGSIWLIVRAVLDYRRAIRGEVTVETDKLNYIEHDRPRVVHTGKRTRTVYENFLHFRSGREFCDPKRLYSDADEEEFITAAYTAEPERILCIYRLRDYNWQE